MLRCKEYLRLLPKAHIIYMNGRMFSRFSLDDLRQMSPFLQTLFLGFYGGEPSQKDLDAVDYRDFMDTTYPALYVYNFAGDELINAQGEIDFDVLYHSFRHSDYLRAKAIRAFWNLSRVTTCFCDSYPRLISNLFLLFTFSYMFSGRDLSSN